MGMRHAVSRKLFENRVFASKFDFAP